MQLFKRMLMSLFPDDTWSQTVNPASIFVSFVSSKEFFSVVHRKIVENYKLNMFDITMDPFEFKIWFGNNPSVQVKDIDAYYAYSAVANFNGYRLYNPSNMGHAMTLLMSTYFYPHFEKYDPKYFSFFLYTLYMLTFVFVSRVKVFDSEDKQSSFNRFVKLLCEFYEFILDQAKIPHNEKILAQIKKDIILQTNCMYTLIAFYRSCNKLLIATGGTEKDFYQRLFHDEIKEGKWKSACSDFVTGYHKYIHDTNCKDSKIILQLILPADILLKYIFADIDACAVSKVILKNAYDQKKIDKILQDIRDDEQKIYTLIEYITDYTLWKKSFFFWVKKFMTHTLNQNATHHEKEELDEFMSEIGDIDNIDMAKIPEKVKKESKIMEKIINFYVTYTGASQAARGDNMRLRFQKKWLLHDILANKNLKTDKKYSLPQYWSMLYAYSKNAFYYKYAADNIRAGKEKFYLPFSSTLKKAQSNIYIIRLLHENIVSTLFQDWNTKDMRLYIKQKDILDAFKKLRGKQISQYIKNKDKELIAKVYQPLAQNLENTDIVDIAQKNIDQTSLFHLRENLYTVDFWIYTEVITQLNIECDLQTNYTDMNMLGIYACIKENLFGLLLYLYALQTNSTDTSKIDAIIDIYITDILHIHEDYSVKIWHIIKRLLIKYNELLSKRIALDDNQKVLNIAIENRNIFSRDKTAWNIKNIVIGEDIMRLRWFVKTVTYYNKRYIMPK